MAGLIGRTATKFGGDTMNKMRLALIGFGEVGTTFSREFLASGRHEISVYDILFDKEPTRTPYLEKAKSIGVKACGSAADAAKDAAVVISAVTASSAYSVAEEAGHYMRPGQIFMDINSVSPATKRKDSVAVEKSGADYVEAAVMSPIKPYGIAVPITLGGKRSADLKAMLDPSGMKLTLGVDEIGKASALKMCRSVMVKGLEALTTECMLVSRLYGVEEEVLHSLKVSYPGLNWEEFAGYKIGRLLEHGRRRAAEMREAADTVRETGLAPLVTTATADRIDWVADAVEHKPELKTIDDAKWRSSLDDLIRITHLEHIGDHKKSK
jgi:3-hydroxyisobutyrate dehydrogenase-like beta-hydroxyacid dehydrogenase